MSGNGLDDITRKTVDCRFTSKAMTDQFLQFLEGYIKAEKVKTDAIHGNFPKFGSIFHIFEENGWKKI